MKYQCIAQLEKKAGNTALLCRALGVSRSGYYAAQARAAQPPAHCQLSAQLRACFYAADKSYGSRRLQKALLVKGMRVGRYRVRSLMRANNLKPTWKRRFIHAANSAHRLPVAENLLNRRFDQSSPNQAWVADITYIHTRRGWLYLAAVMDLYSRRVVGWAMAPNMTSELVCTALQVAIAHRQPPEGMLVHTDQGSQYASEAYRSLLTRHRLSGSMSRRGNCWDNAVMERFFLSLKMERVWQRDYANHNEAVRDISDYIVGFYNSERLHSKLGYLPPTVYERVMAEKQPNKVSENT